MNDTDETDLKAQIPLLFCTLD